jgi:hypothetical protein
MRYGFVVPYADAREFAELAALGEEHGWDGVFTWESLYGEHAWVALGAAAMLTSRIRLGTLLTPASRHRPWDLASMVSTVDRLSGGRVVMSVGLGALHAGWTRFEPDEGRRARAEKLDEGLAVVEGLFGEPETPFSFEGRHWQVAPAGGDAPVDGGPAGPPPPTQRPHPPIWVVGAWLKGRQRQPSLERAARWDGLLASVVDPTRVGPGSGYDLDSYGEIVSIVRRMREDAGLPWEGYDCVVEADSSGEFVQLEGAPADWADAGATWWVESWWSLPMDASGQAEVRRRVQAGPPG